LPAPPSQSPSAAPEAPAPDIPGELRTEVLLVGGGVAGLWTLRRLLAAGVDALLVEPRALGTGQTIAAQGIVHGGIKYTLAGTLTGASEAIQHMPGRWRAALAGTDPVDLSGLEPTCDHYCLWSNGGLRDRLGSFLASRALRGRVEALRREAFPPFFRTEAFRGQVFRLEDFVVDTHALLERLARPAADRILHGTVTGAQAQGGRIEALHLTTPVGEARVRADSVVLTAGTGNEALLATLGARGPAMQRRPLEQVLLRLRWPHPLFAHCITDITRPEPRLTVTTHPLGGDEQVWYVGGAVATRPAPSPEARIARLRDDCARVLPWVDLSQARAATIAVDRAEARQAGGLRPDQAWVGRADGLANVLVGWPTKLALAPDLADRVLAGLGLAVDAVVSGPGPGPVPDPPEIARPVWDALPWRPLPPPGSSS
jgi:glycine/D-amino acid oxidase-like deaminating enzyme